jgi:molybdopterin molybdotransferase
MISYDTALETVLAHASAPQPESIPLHAALGRIVAADIIADIDIPAADVSAMDGFACRTADLDKQLHVIEIIPAGHAPKKAIGPGECSRIMTGAVAPAGADCVVMREHCREENGMVRVVKKAGPANIRRKAEDVRRGDVVISKGIRITPAVTAVLASAGCATIMTSKQPKVGIIATGDELVEPDKIPRAAQIRNSNSYQLFAQTLACGCIPHYYGIVPDLPGPTEAIIVKGLNECDVLLLSGGVSAGDFDFVPAALKRLGMEIIIERLDMKPGKPMQFGILGSKALFGMPGNPVSTFVVFELFVRPYLYKCMGHHYRPLTVQAPIKEMFSRKKADRLEFIPVCFNSAGAVVRPEYHGSAHIHSYIAAEGLIAIPKGCERIEAGADIKVRILQQ